MVGHGRPSLNYFLFRYKLNIYKFSFNTNYIESLIQCIVTIKQKIITKNLVTSREDDMASSVGQEWLAKASSLDMYF